MKKPTGLIIGLFCLIVVAAPFAYALPNAPTPPGLDSVCADALGAVNNSLRPQTTTDSYIALLKMALNPSTGLQLSDLQWLLAAAVNKHVYNPLENKKLDSDTIALNKAFDALVKAGGLDRKKIVEELEVLIAKLTQEKEVKEKTSQETRNVYGHKPEVYFVHKLGSNLKMFYAKKDMGYFKGLQKQEFFFVFASEHIQQGEENTQVKSHFLQLVDLNSTTTQKNFKLPGPGISLFTKRGGQDTVAVMKDNGISLMPLGPNGVVSEQKIDIPLTLEFGRPTNITVKYLDTGDKEILFVSSWNLGSYFIDLAKPERPHFHPGKNPDETYIKYAQFVNLISGPDGRSLISLYRINNPVLNIVDPARLDVLVPFEHPLLKGCGVTMDSSHHPVGRCYVNQHTKPPPTNKDMFFINFRDPYNSVVKVPDSLKMLPGQPWLIDYFEDLHGRKGLMGYEPNGTKHFFKVVRGELIEGPVPPVKSNPPGSFTSHPFFSFKWVNISLPDPWRHIVFYNEEVAGMPPVTLKTPTGELRYFEVVQFQFHDSVLDGVNTIVAVPDEHGDIIVFKLINNLNTKQREISP